MAGRRLRRRAGHLDRSHWDEEMKPGKGERLNRKTLRGVGVFSFSSFFQETPPQKKIGGGSFELYTLEPPKKWKRQPHMRQIAAKQVLPVSTKSRVANANGTKPRLGSVCQAEGRQKETGTGVLLGEIDGFPWLIKPPGKPGIAIYFSTRTTKKDTYGNRVLRTTGSA